MRIAQALRKRVNPLDPGQRGLDRLVHQDIAGGAGDGSR